MAAATTAAAAAAATTNVSVCQPQTITYNFIILLSCKEFKVDTKQFVGGEKSIFWRQAVFWLKFSLWQCLKTQGYIRLLLTLKKTGFPETTDSLLFIYFEAL